MSANTQGSTNGRDNTAALAKRNEKPDPIGKLIDQLAPEIEKALTSSITKDRFVRALMTLLRADEKFLEMMGHPAGRLSLMGAIMHVGQLGLDPEPSMQQVYILAYRIKGVLYASVQIGYQGYVELALRSGHYTKVSAHVIHENDDYEIALGTDERIKHIPTLGPRGKRLAAYAVAFPKDGAPAFELCHPDDIAKSQASSRKQDMWQANPEEYWRKTAIRRAQKYWRKSTEMRNAEALDGGVVRRATGNVADDVTYDTVDAEVIDVPAEPAAIVDDRGSAIVERSFAGDERQVEPARTRPSDTPRPAATNGTPKPAPTAESYLRSQTKPILAKLLNSAAGLDALRDAAAKKATDEGWSLEDAQDHVQVAKDALAAEAAS